MADQAWSGLIRVQNRAYRSVLYTTSTSSVVLVVALSQALILHSNHHVLSTMAQATRERNSLILRCVSLDPVLILVLFCCRPTGMIAVALPNCSFFSLFSFSSISPSTSFQSSSSDLYHWHGHEHIAKLCARFFSHLFACPDVPQAPPPSAPFHCVRAPSYAPSHVRHLCRVVPPTTPEGSLLRRKGLVWSPPFHLRVYDRLQDYLRRHLFQQVVVHC